LASLLTSSASVAGQRIVLIPLSSSPTSTAIDDGNSYAAEPPCRQRRLAPWRQRVRDRCRAAAERHCPSEERDLRREGPRDASTYISFSPVSTIFEELFAPNFHDAGIEDATEDPLDALFNRMLGFSLRAFDQMVVGEEQPASPEEEGAKEESPAASSPSEGASAEDASAEDASSAVSLFLEYVESAPTPEQAAENALDLMVASLAAHSNAAAAASVDVQEMEDDAALEEPEEEEGGEEAWDDILLAAADLPWLLSQYGDALLADAAEGEAVENPREHAKRRLARRLTEYRSDLFFSRADGSVALYTANFLSPSSPVFGGIPAFTQQQEEDPPALGMGSRHLDTCVRSAFQNRDLSGGCHQAVGELLLAVDHGSRASPYHKEFVVATTPNKEGTTFPTVFGMLALAGLLGAAFARFCGGEDEEDETTEEEVGKFHCAALPSNDAHQLPRVSRPLGKQRVFVGVPVQVV